MAGGYQKSGATIVYDGECPFCSRYVQMVALQDAVGQVTLLNARDGGPVVDGLRADGYDLDEGMVLIQNGELYHGHDCINRLALLSTSSRFFNRLNAVVFQSPTASRLLYPILRFGRNTVLRFLGRSKIADS